MTDQRATCSHGEVETNVGRGYMRCRKCGLRVEWADATLAAEPIGTAEALWRDHSGEHVCAIRMSVGMALGRTNRCDVQRALDTTRPAELDEALRRVLQDAADAGVIGARALLAEYARPEAPVTSDIATDQRPSAAEALREALESIRDHGYQPIYNGRPSCPFCGSFVDDEQTHDPTCVLLATLDATRPAFRHIDWCPSTGPFGALDCDCPYTEREETMLDAITAAVEGLPKHGFYINRAAVLAILRGDFR